MYEPWCDAELLKGLEQIREHPVWGQAPAAMEDVSWLPKSVSLVEFLEALRVVTANRMLENKSLQQLQQAFLGFAEAMHPSIQQLQFAKMTPDSVRNENVSSVTVGLITCVYWIKVCDVLAMQMY